MIGQCAECEGYQDRIDRLQAEVERLRPLQGLIGIDPQLDNLRSALMSEMALADELAGLLRRIEDGLYADHLVLARWEEARRGRT